MFNFQLLHMMLLLLVLLTSVTLTTSLGFNTSDDDDICSESMNKFASNQDPKLIKIAEVESLRLTTDDGKKQSCDVKYLYRNKKWIKLVCKKFQNAIHRDLSSAVLCRSFLDKDKQNLYGYNVHNKIKVSRFNKVGCAYAYNDSSKTRSIVCAFKRGQRS